jgi:hypothetical protein
VYGATYEEWVVEGAGGNHTRERRKAQLIMRVSKKYLPTIYQKHFFPSTIHQAPDSQIPSPTSGYPLDGHPTPCQCSKPNQPTMQESGNSVLVMQKAKQRQEGMQRTKHVLTKPN